MTSPLSPLQDRLRPFEATWQDSLKHPLLRDNGYLRLSTQSTSNCLWLTLDPQGRGPRLRWRVPPGLDPASLPHLSWTLTVGSWAEITVSAFLIGALTLIPSAAGTTPYIWPLLVVLVLLTVVIGAMAEWRAQGQRRIVEGLLREAMSEPASGGTTAAT